MSETSPPRLLIVNYHYIRPADYRYPGIHPLPPEQFRAQVEGLKRTFHFASPEEVESFAQGIEALPRDSVFVTFDDGLRDQADAARDVLEPLGIKGAFFACSRPALEGKALSVHKVHWLRAHTEPARFAEAFFDLVPGGFQLDQAQLGRASEMYVYDVPEIGQVKFALNFVLDPQLVDDITSQMLLARGIDEREFCDNLYMNEREMKRLAETGHVVGVHGHSHVPLSRLGGALLEDVQTNVRFIERATDVQPRWVSYPYGRDDAIPSNAELDHLFAEFDFRVGVTLTGTWNEWPTDRRRLQRINTNEVPDITARLQDNPRLAELQ